MGKFPCLRLARAAAQSGGLQPATLNAANEVAVQAFLDRQLNFIGIAAVIEAVITKSTGGRIGGLDDVLAADSEARQLAREQLGAASGGARVAHSGVVRGRARMNFIWTVLWFIVAVSLLVTVHEFGHYWVARRLGFKVLRFSVGFGRPLISRVAGADRTEYVLASIPLGGYVKLLDEREGPVAAADLKRSFTRKPPWQRILVLLAGPAFNIAFAILVLWGIFWVKGITEFKPVVGDVVVSSVAARGGLRSGDEILAINGAAVAGQRDVMFDLLDAVSSRGEALLAVRGKDGAARTANLSIPDRAERVRLTEPAALLRGLGFEFWLPPLPAVLGEVSADGPAARAGLKSRRSDHGHRRSAGPPTSAISVRASAPIPARQ